MAQLNEIRANRTKLDEQERQTIQTIKRKLQEQRKALAQLELELQQLGVTLEESTPDRAPIRQTGFETNSQRGTAPRAPEPEPLDLPRTERRW